jgi:uncharacterized protein (TIGR03435 family)
MQRVVTALSFVVVVSAAVSGQSPLTTPTFDAADVHVRSHTSNPNPYMTGGVLRGGRYDLRNATMLDLITTAYGVFDPDLVVGGPSWLETDRFDIIATAPNATSQDTLKVMLQTLLADRFKLVLHTDTKPMPGFALTLGTGKHKLKAASGNGASGCQGQPSPNSQPGVVPANVVACRNMTMAAFADLLRPMVGGAYLTGPVADRTGLLGAWDFELTWTNRGQLALAGADGLTIFDAIDKQLGLKLTPQAIAVPVRIVDRVNEKPADNPSGVAQNLPAPPAAEFDVADIKLSGPDARPTGPPIRPGGRISIEGVTLKNLITLAWDFNDDQLLVGAPSWLDSTHYSVTAIASTAVAGSGNAMQVDIDDLRLMLRALLADRFKLATHMEDRPVSAYTLVADKPKLQKADPSTRTRWKEGPAVSTKDPRDTNPIVSRLVTCQNMTMAQFAEDLQNIAPGYLRLPVADATGLDGAWDFTFNFSPVNLLQAPAGRGGDNVAGSAVTASDPNGAVSLFDALTKQLGLKLEMRKRPMPVLVIDHVEEKPTDN